MSEVLSQNEIDALLNALNSGEVDVSDIKEESQDKKIKKYDFRNPQKIAKDQLRTLEIIHDNFARLIQTYLSGYLRSAVKVSVLTVDQYAYSEFSNAISNPAFLSVINFRPLSGQIIMDISTNIAFAIIDRLLGGDGKNTSDIRPFTEIEVTLLTKVVNRIINFIVEAWDNVIKLDPYLEKIETNSQFAQIVSPSETVALITLNISIGEIEGMMNVCIPHIVIEPILDKLSTKFWFSTSKKDITKNEVKVIEKRMRNVKVEISAVLGSNIITVGELLDLQNKDVIKLDTKANAGVKIKIGSNYKFIGIPGTKNNKMAVKIQRVLKDGDDVNDK